MCAIDLFSIYAWAVPIKDKKRTSILNAFKKKSQREENQIKYGLIKVLSFIIILLKIFFKINKIEIYSTYNEGKSAVAERFIRNLNKKKKKNRHMTAISKNVYFDVLDDIVDKYNNK